MRQKRLLCLDGASELSPVLKVEPGNFTFLAKRPAYLLLSSRYSRMVEYPFTSLRNLRKWRSKSHCDMMILQRLIGYISRVIAVAQIHLCFLMSKSPRNRVIHTCAFGCSLCPMSQMELVDALGADMTSGQHLVYCCLLPAELVGGR